MPIYWMGRNNLFTAEVASCSYFICYSCAACFDDCLGRIVIGEDPSDQQKIGMGLILIAVICVTIMGAVEADAE